MKKLVILIITVFAVISLFAHNDLMQPTNRLKQDKTKVIVPSVTRDQELPPAPSYNFSIAPIDLGGTVYDYMPGSYCSLPIRVQPETTNSGTPAGGVYIAYHNRVSSNSNRRVNYAYISSSGELVGSGPIASADNWEGYPGIDIDPVTTDPFVVYHLDANGDGVYDDNFSYDQYGMAQMPGLWLDPPYTAIDNAQLQNIGIIQSGDEMIWPYVYVGASPLEGKRRVYITANNFQNSTGSAAAPSENVVLAYADFDENDLMAQSPATWNWQYRTVQQFDDWHNENPEWARAMKTFAVKDNYVVYIGELLYGSDSANNPKLFALVNDNYGEGDFTYYEFDYQNAWPISDVQKQDGSWLYGNTAEAQLKWGMAASGHLNALFTGDNTISFTGALVVEFLDPSDNTWYYAPAYGMMYVKEFTFNIQTGEFGVIDVYPPDLSGTENNTPVVPWDLNGDGEVDAYDEDGYPVWVPSLPVFHTNLDNSFHYNSIKLTKSDDNSMEAMVWNDCYEAWLQANGYEGYDDWAETSKIMIATKVDGVWKTPIIIDAKQGDDHYNDAINGMIPCYVYPGDKIQTESEDTARLHLFFLNDDSYGSSIQSEGNNPNPDNCRLEYAAIDFSTLESEVNQISSANVLDAVNYPNPFNPVTTIKYNVAVNANVTVEVYNLRGQKVITLVNSTQKPGEHSVVWDGTDDNGKTVGSGIYLYKIKNGKYTSTKKMILMK